MACHWCSSQSKPPGNVPSILQGVCDLLLESDRKYEHFRRQYEKSVLSCRYDSSLSIQDTTTLLRRDYTLLVDVRSLNRILDLNHQTGVLEVEAGIEWLELTGVCANESPLIQKRAARTSPIGRTTERFSLCIVETLFTSRIVGRPMRFAGIVRLNLCFTRKLFMRSGAEPEPVARWHHFAGNGVSGLCCSSQSRSSSKKYCP
jgi:hypothetical protein